MNSRYIFLVKGDAVTQICDDEPESEEIKLQLLKQGFYISHLHVYASSDRLAFQKYIEHYEKRRVSLSEFEFK